jgi:hypothetical protein
MSPAMDRPTRKSDEPKRKNVLQNQHCRGSLIIASDGDGDGDGDGSDAGA